MRQVRQVWGEITWNFTRKKCPFFFPSISRQDACRSSTATMWKKGFPYKTCQQKCEQMNPVHCQRMHPKERNIDCAHSNKRLSHQIHSQHIQTLLFGKCLSTKSLLNLMHFKSSLSKREWNLWSLATKLLTSKKNKCKHKNKCIHFRCPNVGQFTTDGKQDVRKYRTFVLCRRVAPLNHLQTFLFTVL